MRQHSKRHPGIFLDCQVWPQEGHKIYSEKLAALGLSVDDELMRKMKCSCWRALPGKDRYISSRNNRDDGGLFDIIQCADMHVRILSDHDSGDMDGWEREV